MIHNFAAKSALIGRGPSRAAPLGWGHSPFGEADVEVNTSRNDITNGFVFFNQRLERAAAGNDLRDAVYLVGQAVFRNRGYNGIW